MSYQRRNEEVYLSTHFEKDGPKETAEQLRKNFALQLRYCIKRAYGGKIPSYAIIARDFSLRAPAGGAVSAETIRKWLKGVSIPQSARLRTLIQWFGIELAHVLQLVDGPNHHEYQVDAQSPQSNFKNPSSQMSDPEIENYLELRIFLLIKKLSSRDREMVLSMLEALRQSRNDQQE